MPSSQETAKYNRKFPVDLNPFIRLERPHPFTITSNSFPWENPHESYISNQEIADEQAKVVEMLLSRASILGELPQQRIQAIVEEFQHGAIDSKQVEHEIKQSRERKYLLQFLTIILPEEKYGQIHIVTELLNNQDAINFLNQKVRITNKEKQDLIDHVAHKWEGFLLENPDERNASREIGRVLVRITGNFNHRGNYLQQKYLTVLELSDLALTLIHNLNYLIGDKVKKSYLTKMAAFLVSLPLRALDTDDDEVEIFEEAVEVVRDFVAIVSSFNQSPPGAKEQNKPMEGKELSEFVNSFLGHRYPGYGFVRPPDKSELKDSASAILARRIHTYILHILAERSNQG